MLKQLLLLLKYCRHPRPYLKKVLRQSDQFVAVHQLLFLTFFLEMIAMSFINLMINLDELDHAAEGLLENLGPIVFFFFGVIIAPLFEEIIFRFTMKYAKYAFSGLLLALGFTAFTFIPYLDIIAISLITGSISMGVIASVLFFHSIGRKPMGKELLKVIHRKYFRWIYYGQAIIFGLIHISNYNIARIDQVYMLPLLVMPQIIFGFVLGYSRIKYGFWSNLYLHMIHNAVLISLTTYALQQGQ